MVQKRIMPKAQRGEHDSDATNAAYLAALLDLKAFGARRSRNTNKVLHVGIKLTTTRKWAEVQWPLLKEAYGIKAEIRVPIQRGPSVVKGKVAQANREPAYAIYTDDPASVKKLLVAARPYMWRGEEADRVIAACNELLGLEGEA